MEQTPCRGLNPPLDGEDHVRGLRCRVDAVFVAEFFKRRRFRACYNRVQNPVVKQVPMHGHAALATLHFHGFEHTIQHLTHPGIVKDFFRFQVIDHCR